MINTVPLLFLLPVISALQLCQQADLCISFEHRNVSLPVDNDVLGPHPRYVHAIDSAELCEVGHARLAAGIRPSDTVLLVRDEGQGLSLEDVLAAAADTAGVIMASDDMLVDRVLHNKPATVLVSKEEGLQIQYLARIVNMKVPLTVDLFKGPSSQYDLLEEVQTYRTYAKIGLPFLTDVFHLLNKGLRSSENNVHLMIARYRKAMSADWGSRPGQRASVGGPLTVLHEADIHSMEDFALQTASYFIVLVVAAMLGAVGAHLLTSTSRRLRVASVSNLPIVSFVHPDNNSEQDPEDCVDAVRLLTDISSSAGPLMTRITALVNSISDQAAEDFLSFLSTHNAQLFQDIQDVMESACQVLEKKSPMKALATRPSAVSRRHSSRRVAMEPDKAEVNVLYGGNKVTGWSTDRLMQTIDNLLDEYYRFQADSQTSRSVGVRRDHCTTVAQSAPKKRALKVSRDEDNNTLGHTLLGLHNYFIQFRDTHLLDGHSNEVRETPGKGVACRICLAEFKEGESLMRLPCDHLLHRECGKPWLTDSSPYCPVCQHFGNHRLYCVH